METHNKEQEELKKIAPHLHNIEKKEVFITPENYFETLPRLMQDKVNAGRKPKNFWIPDYKLALAVASICLFIFAGINYFNPSKNESTEIATTEIAQQYDNEYLASADENDLVDELDDESLASTSQQIAASNDISNSEIEDYLISDNVDLTTITNEF